MPNDAIDSSSSTNPMTPAIPKWGRKNSRIISPSPSQKNRNAMFGSNSECRNPTNGPSSSLVIVASDVRRVSVRPSAIVTVRPSMSASSASTLGAIRSITPSSSASSAEELIASRTARSAHSAFLPCSSARARAYATLSSTAFCEAIAPDSPTGVAAPTLVPGAIAATGHESKMYIPAEAARAPEGAT